MNRHWAIRSLFMSTPHNADEWFFSAVTTEATKNTVAIVPKQVNMNNSNLSPELHEFKPSACLCQSDASREIAAEVTDICHP